MINSIDHLVLPVGGLELARVRLRALGFNVAPDGVHPFGTANCCVFLPEGPYLEPLGLADRELCQFAAEQGNSFVIRDRLFRKAKGEEGLSAIVFQSLDAEADDRQFQALGLSAGRPLEFRRLATNSQGKSVEAGFRLSFADLQSDVLFAFSCQRIASLSVDRSLQSHQNTARKVSAVVLASHNIDQDATRLSLVLQSEPARHEREVSFELCGTRILIKESGQEVPEFGFKAPVTHELSATALVVTVEDLAAAQSHLSDQGVVFQMINGSCIVSHEDGQGVAVIFQQASDN